METAAAPPCSANPESPRGCRDGGTWWDATRHGIPEGPAGPQGAPGVPGAVLPRRRRRLWDGTGRDGRRGLSRLPLKEPRRRAAAQRPAERHRPAPCAPPPPSAASSSSSSSSSCRRRRPPPPTSGQRRLRGSASGAASAPGQRGDGARSVRGAEMGNPRREGARSLREGARSVRGAAMGKPGRQRGFSAGVLLRGGAEAPRCLPALGQVLAGAQGPAASRRPGRCGRSRRGRAPAAPGASPQPSGRAGTAGAAPGAAAGGELWGRRVGGRSESAGVDRRTRRAPGHPGGKGLERINLCERGTEKQGERCC